MVQSPSSRKAGARIIRSYTVKCGDSRTVANNSAEKRIDSDASLRQHRSASTRTPSALARYRLNAKRGHGRRSDQKERSEWVWYKRGSSKGKTSRTWVSACR